MLEKPRIIVTPPEGQSELSHHPEHLWVYTGPTLFGEIDQAQYDGRTLSGIWIKKDGPDYPVFLEGLRTGRFEGFNTSVVAYPKFMTPEDEPKDYFGIQLSTIQLSSVGDQEIIECEVQVDSNEPTLSPFQFVLLLLKYLWPVVLVLIFGGLVIYRLLTK